MSSEGVPPKRMGARSADTNPPPSNKRTVRSAADAKGQAAVMPGAEFKGYGFTVRIPLPKWAVGLLAALLVTIAICAVVYIAGDYVLHRSWIPTDQYAQYTEIAKHAKLISEVKDSKSLDFPEDGMKVVLNHFSSDGCIQIVRIIRSSETSEGFWMYGPRAHPEHVHTAELQSGQGPQLAAQTVTRVDTSVKHAYRTLNVISTSSELQLRGFQSPVPLQAPYRAPQCLNPHPGQYREQFERVSSCAARVWRTFQDSCVHFQWYNPCNNAWDVYPNGTPKVTWTHCIH